MLNGEIQTKIRAESAFLHKDSLSSFETRHQVSSSTKLTEELQKKDKRTTRPRSERLCHKPALENTAGVTREPQNTPRGVTPALRTGRRGWKYLGLFPWRFPKPQFNGSPRHGYLMIYQDIIFLNLRTATKGTITHVVLHSSGDGSAGQRTDWTERRLREPQPEENKPVSSRTVAWNSSGKRHLCPSQVCTRAAEPPGPSSKSEQSDTATWPGHYCSAQAHSTFLFTFYMS